MTGQNHLDPGGENRDLERLLREALAEALNIPPHEINPAARFKDMGLDSGKATALIPLLETRLERALSSTLFWEAPCLSDLLNNLTGTAAAMNRQSAGSIDTASISRPIAVVGLSCRFPGGADNPDAFWRLLCRGIDAIGPAPEERLHLSRFHDPELSRPGTTNSIRGGFLDRVDGFDADFFGISLREAVQMDPQQRLMLELAWEALEDAGRPPADMRDSNTGVFVGAMWDDYARLNPVEAFVQHTATGLDSSIIAARISYSLGLMGPSVTLNTACSASLVAVHQARRALQCGEADLALAGAVNLILAPHSTVAMAQFGGLGKDARVKAFDAAANGYVRGEGAAFTVLKPLDRALVDGDRIYAILEGSAVNNDGYSNGLTAPNPAAQQQVIAKALADAGVDGSEVQYVEAHGTGTRLGDPIETSALGAVYGCGRDPSDPLHIGSVKTNIGHLEAAAGMAGLLKTVLALQADWIPANLNFANPNPAIDLAARKLRVQDQAGPWPAGFPRRAGVSSFGFGGTNAHVILREPPARRRSTVFLVADSAEELGRLALERAEQLETETYPGSAFEPLINDEGSFRMAVSGADHRDLAATLRERAKPARPTRLSAGGRPEKPVFVFSGHGSQWPGMGRVLLAAEPVFHHALVECDRALKPFTGWSAVERLVAGDFSSESFDVTQPLLFAIQVALTRLWEHHGVEPGAVVGHSVGEVAAAHVAGMLDLEDAARLVVSRSRLLQQIQGSGRALLVPLDEKESRKAVETHTANPDDIHIICLNAPEQTVIQGPPDAIVQLGDILNGQGHVCRVVRANCSPHSPAVEPLLEPLANDLTHIRPMPPMIPFASSVTGEILRGTAGSVYWQQNLRQKVRFVDAVDCLLAEGRRTFIELSPHPLLTRAVEATAAVSSQSVFTLGTLHRDEDDVLRWQACLGEWFETGFTPTVHKPDGPPRSRSAEGCAAQPYLLAAHREKALTQRARDLLAWLESRPHARDLPAQLAGLHQGEERLVLFADTTTTLADRLQSWLEGQEPADCYRGRAAVNDPVRPVFVFPGQGSQWLGMGRELYRTEPVFRRSIEDCARVFDDLVDWSLADELFATPETSRLAEVNVVQPVLFAIQVSLAKLWQHMGVKPAAVIGHSMGEVAAAHISGALSLEQAAKVICLRSKIVSESGTGGAMAVVACDPDLLQPHLQEHAGRLTVAAKNDPESHLLSGPPELLDRVLDQLARQGAFCRRINVDYASHSAYMEPLLPRLRQTLEPLRPQSETTPFFSTVTASSHSGEQLDPEYWCRNLRRPVRFHETAALLLEQGYNYFIEISPNPVLTVSLERTVAASDHDATVSGSLRNDIPEQQSLLHTLAALHVRGYPLNWSSLLPRRGPALSLPPYPWLRQSFWLPQTHEKHAAGQPAPARTATHPFLGERLRSPLPQLQFQGKVSAADPAYLNDHRVDGVPILPMVAYLEAAFAAGAHHYKDQPFCLVNLTIHQPLILATEHHEFLVNLVEPGSPSRWRLYVSSGRTGTEETWNLLAEAELSPGDGEPRPVAEGGVLDGMHVETWDKTRFYAATDAAGLNYGPAFNGLRKIRSANGRAVSDVAPIPVISGLAWPPAVLDACLQTYFATLAQDGTIPKSLPVSIGRVRMHPYGGGALRTVVVPNQQTPSLMDLSISDQQGRTLVQIEALCVQEAGSDFAARIVGEKVRNMIFHAAWVEAPRSRISDRKPGHWYILADDRALGEQLAARLKRTGAVAELLPICQPEELGPLLEQKLAHLKQAAQWVWLADRGGAGLPATDQLEEDTMRHFAVWQQLAAALAQSSLPEQKLFLVTRGAAALNRETVHLDPQQAMLWGFARSLDLELPDLDCHCLDLDPLPHPDSLARDADMLARVLAGLPTEKILAFRDETVKTPRLQPGLPEETETDSQKLNLPATSYYLAALPDGAGLAVQPLQVTPPGPGQVCIQVEAAGLNYRDVMNVLGTYPGDPGLPGLECAGRVIAVGPGATRLQPGDEVVAFCSGALADRVTVAAELTAPKPKQQSYAMAASWPITYMTAAHGLERLARLATGEKLLVHAAAGGVGLAAIQIAQKIGAVIFATAGSPRKRAYLRGLGVDHIFDSRDPNFHEELLAAAGPEGVDVVLNSLVGPFIEHSFNVLKRGGRFVEIGKTGIWSPEKVSELAKDIQYFPFDLVALAENDPTAMGALLQELSERFSRGDLQLPPAYFRVFPMDRANWVVTQMAHGRHMGKQVLQNPPEQTPSIRDDGVYVITGGTGALGLHVARRLLDRGVRNLVLFSRRGTNEAVRSLETEGVRIKVCQADVADTTSLAAALEEARTLGPLRGVIHAAGVLGDGLALNRDWNSYRPVLQPKVFGTRNLMDLCGADPLDFFLMFSSIASWFGSAGQTGYAAANAFEDAVADYGRGIGLPVTGIAWGTWAGAGLAADADDRGVRHWLDRGIDALQPDEGIAALDLIIPADAARVAVFKWSEETQRNPVTDLMPLLDQRVNPGEATAEPIERERVETPDWDTLASGDLTRAVYKHTRACLLDILGFDPDHEVSAERGFREMGLDSLMTVSLRNRLCKDTGLALPATLAFNYPNLRALCDFLTECLLKRRGDEAQAEPSDAGSVAEEEPLAPSDDDEEALDDLSGAELAELLADEMEGLDI
ncbi:MAG: SDR family NAD(P)-dependent oxidoreductase [Acidobacteriota bacterium]|nr:SDR family NAD(P)-dependent oxidoreductase [Acidobacteriota bacterium]